METIELTGNLRTKTGKGISRQLRRNGLIPGIVYGGNKNYSISIDNKVFSSLLKKTGINVILNLKIENNNGRTVVIKELQRDVITRDFLHVDLLEISMTKKLKIKVPIEETGTAIGIKMGGILTHLLRKVKAECLPTNIPQSIKIDVTNLEVGQSIHIRDIKVPDGINILDNPDETICVIKLPEAEKSKEAEEEAAETPADEAAAETPADESEKTTKEKEKDK